MLRQAADYLVVPGPGGVVKSDKSAFGYDKKQDFFDEMISDIKVRYLDRQRNILTLRSHTGNYAVY